ncbi:hypothetical protein VNO77_08627 [Canavalia gladiata]|uniref:Uncharacterized protein n=1 Tax=Canavalia gladiata TaxID=3824 RepID=A0AAN9ME19_CANGL
MPYATLLHFFSSAIVKYRLELRPKNPTDVEGKLGLKSATYKFRSHCYCLCQDLTGMKIKDSGEHDVGSEPSMPLTLNVEAFISLWTSSSVANRFVLTILQVPICFPAPQGLVSHVMLYKLRGTRPLTLSFCLKCIHNQCLDMVNSCYSGIDSTSNAAFSTRKIPYIGAHCRDNVPRDS